MATEIATSGSRAPFTAFRRIALDHSGDLLPPTYLAISWLLEHETAAAAL
jgi:hypothetical protein